MITVTNGTVSRTYKVGDYEPRVVSLSFNIDPGSDVERLVADVVGMVERLARQTPNPVQEKYGRSPGVEAGSAPSAAAAEVALAPVKRRLTGDEIVGEAHPPPPLAPAPIEAVPTPASVSAPEPAPVVPVIPTAENVIRAAQEAVKRVGVERRHEVTAIVNKFVDAPNMPIRSTPEAKRADLIAALAELGKSSDY